MNVNNNTYTCCAKMAGKEETPKCRKKTVTWTNEMIEDLIDFIEIHPIVDLFLEFNLLRTTIVHNNAIQRAAPSFPPKNAICLLHLQPKLVCIHQNFLHRVYTNLNSSFLIQVFLNGDLDAKLVSCIPGLMIVLYR